MHHESASARFFHLFARYHYLQDLIEHQRVLVIGRAEAASGDALDRQGIRRAVFIDSSEERVVEARRGCASRRVEFMVGPLARVALVEDSFDVAIIEDFGKLENRIHDLAAAKRGLTSSGVLVACIPNPDTTVAFTSLESASLGYYEFYGQLADSFPFVRMIGQCPLVGFALADLSVDDPEASITFDSSMLEDGSEDAEFFVALCSRSPIDADPFAVVQVPLSWIDASRLVGAQKARPTEPAPPAQAPAEPVEPRRSDALEAELARKEEDASREISKLKIEIDKRAVTIAKLENHLREAREKAAIEHDRVIQTKLALESEKKKVLGLQKDAEMGRRIQKMAPAPDEAPPEADRGRAPDQGEAARRRVGELDQQSKVLEQKLAAAFDERDRLAVEVEALRAEIDASADGSSELDALEDELETERAARRQAESRAAELESRASRADVLAADLGRERGARKLAESHAVELERRLKEAKQAPDAVKRLSPTEEALKKAEAAFSGASLAEQVDQLRAHLMHEAEAREAAEARLAELGSAGDPARKLQEELAGERDARRHAEETVITLEARLSQAEALVARLKAEGEARQRAESVFGIHQPRFVAEATTQIPAATMVEFTESVEARRLAEEALEQERALRLEAEARLAASERRADDVHTLEIRLDQEKELRQTVETELAHFVEARREQEDTAERPVEDEDAESEPVRDDVVAELERKVQEERRLRREAAEDLASLEEQRGLEIAELEAALRSRGDEVAELSRELTNQAEVLRRVIEDLQEAQAGAPDLDSRAARQGAEILELRGRLAAAEAECERLQADLDDRSRELTALSGEIQGTEWRVAELRLDARGAADLEPGVAEADAPMLSLSGGHPGLVEAQASAAAPAPDVASDLASARSRVDRLEKEQARLLAELETCRGSERALEAVIDRLRKDQGAATGQLQEEALRRERLEEELAEARQAAAEIDRDLASAQACVSMLEEQIPGVSEVLRDLRADDTGEFPAPLRDVGFMQRRTGMTAAAGESPGSHLETLREQLAYARDEADRAMTRETVLQARLDECVAELDLRTDEVRTLSDRIAELERETTSTGDRSARLMGELAQAQAVAALAQGELAEVRERLEAAGLESARWSASVEQLENRLAEVSSRLEEERARSNGLGQELADERAGSRELREQLEDAQLHAETLDDELDRLRAAVPRAETATQAAVEGLERLLAASRRAIAERDGEIAGLRFAIGELDLAVREARATAAPAIAEPGPQDRVAAELEAARERAAELQRAMTRLEESESRHLERIDDLEAALADARHRVGELEYIGRHAEEWADRLEAAEREGARLRAEIGEAQARLAEARSQLERAGAASGELAGLRDQLAQQVSQIESLQQERREAEAALERVVDGFSEASGDAAALIELLSDRDDLIQRLEQHLGKDRLTPRDIQWPSIDEGTETVEGCLQKLEAARRIVKSLEGDKRRLSITIDDLLREKQRLNEELVEARKAERS
jgi:chromosome segregation ATPase